MTVVDGRWPFAGRDAEAAAIAAAIGDEAARGVVVVGPSGIGKTMIAQHVVSSLSRQVDHIYIRGSAAHSSTPYGALNVLLAELDEDTARSPLLVLSALQRRFDTDPTQRRTLMHIDGVEEIDELSATVIAQLARVRAVRLLITCEDLLKAPVEFFDLWKDRVLSRFDIEPLTLDATTEVLAAALGGPISRSAAQELWLSSDGNPKYLQIATKADVASGHLFPRDGVWVCRDTHRPESGRSFSDWTTSTLVALPSADRATVETLAVAGTLPVPILLHAVPPGSIDALQRERMITVDRASTPLVRLTYDVFADVVRSQVLSERGRDALETVSALRDEPGVTVRARTSLAAWSLDQGLELDSAALVGLARSANDHRIDGAAARFLDAVDPAPGTVVEAAAVVERSRQHLADGHVAEALRTIEGLLEEDLPEPQLRAWVEARLLAARLRAGTQGREQDVAELLEQVDARLAREDPSTDPFALREQAEVVRLELLVFEGEVDTVCARAPELLAQWADDTPWSIRVRSLLGVAEATRGSQEQAVTIARNVASRLDVPVCGEIAPLDRDAASVHLYGTLLMAGYWSECLDLANRREGRSGAILYGGSVSEFAQGVLLSYLGRSSEALNLLMPAISQFRIRDRHGFLPLAEAAAAYAQVLENAPDAAEDHLKAIDLDAHRYPWHIREAVTYFTLLVEAWLESTEDVASKFREHALELGASGRRGAELFFVSQAVQLGGHESADVLTTTAGASDGPFARLLEHFGTALTARDPAALKELARRAVELGNHNLAGDIAALSIEHLAETDDPMIRVHAEQILRRTSTPARRHVRRKLLSERERAIARKVALGVPNKEIAQQEHISPRTVEGHVHQIMSKLGLSSRKQLSLIFGQSQ
ncbi:LuxR C-terminal-related transcriptional regulator [Arthrobacter sp. CP30]